MKETIEQRNARYAEALKADNCIDISVDDTGASFQTLDGDITWLSTKQLSYYYAKLVATFPNSKLKEESDAKL